MGLDGTETYTIDVDDDVKPGEDIHVRAVCPDGKRTDFTVLCRLDTPVEVDYYPQRRDFAHGVEEYSLEFGQSKSVRSTEYLVKVPSESNHFRLGTFY